MYRCKHKCKNECRHPCCQRAREQELAGKPREFRFQSRILDSAEASSAERRSMSFSKPTSSLTLLGSKRKADGAFDEPSDSVDENAFDDDLDGPQDLLSKLDRMTAAADRAAGTIQPLQMPSRNTLSSSSVAQGERNERFRDVTRQSRSFAAGQVRPTQFSESPAPANSSSSLDSTADNSRKAAEDTRQRIGSADSEHTAESSAIATERPAQRRFLKLLDTPSWLASSRSSTESR